MVEEELDEGDDNIAAVPWLTVSNVEEDQSLCDVIGIG